MLRWAEFYAPVSTALMIMIAGIHPTIFSPPSELPEISDLGENNLTVTWHQLLGSRLKVIIVLSASSTSSILIF